MPIARSNWLKELSRPLRMTKLRALSTENSKLKNAKPVEVCREVGAIVAVWRESDRGLVGTHDPSPALSSLLDRPTVLPSENSLISYRTNISSRITSRCPHMWTRRTSHCGALAQGWLLAESMITTRDSSRRATRTPSRHPIMKTTLSCPLSFTSVLKPQCSTAKEAYLPVAVAAPQLSLLFNSVCLFMQAPNR